MQITAHRPAVRRIALTTVAALAAGSLAAIAAAAAAAATGPVTAADKALFAYAKCMRDKGVKIPDPAEGKDGKFTFPAIAKSVTGAAGVREKARACAGASGALGNGSGGAANGNGPRGGQGGFGRTQTPAQQAAFKKFQDCLTANGATLTAPRPGQRPPATGATTPKATTTTGGKIVKPAIAGNGPDANGADAGPGGGRGFGAGGGRGGLRGGFGDAKTQAAFQKCRALLPTRPASAG